MSEAPRMVNIERRGRVAIVRFDRGTRANPMSLELCRQLTAAARSFENDSETSAIVLTGTAGNFTNGADLKDPALARAREAPLAERRVLMQTGGRMCRAWEELEPVTIAAVEGWCVGGGAAIAVSCDLRAAATDATFYVPEIERGMNLSWGAVPRITHLVGPSKAKRIIILSEKIPAPRAADWGLVDELAEPGRALDAALAMAERVASMPPVQVRMTKQAINASANALDRAVSHADFDQYMVAAASGDFAEGVRAFLERRPPNYTGR